MNEIHTLVVINMVSKAMHITVSRELFQLVLF